VALEFEVEVLDPLDRLGLGDRQAVDEKPRRHQHLVEIERVAGRDPQVARRHAMAERAGGDHDRQHIVALPRIKRPS
jgi:hypothetical protein